MPIVPLPVPEEINGGEIPEDTRVRVEALPFRNVVWDGIASGSVTLNLDLGKYVVKMTKPLTGRNIWNQQFEFLNGVTEEQFAVLCSLSPKRAISRQVSDGNVMLTCQMGFDCKKKTSSAVDMILHEAEHMGISRADLLNPKNHENIALMLHDAQETAKTGPDKQNPMRVSKRDEVLGTAKPRG